ncbi:type III-B CRISPR module RAMP protein Cmr6 [Rosettibacter firmus]|uniref:type III-B CRISPR module RAMP protein Cmr6 n=1 Tax=Rosettibacter firmus TaxID=3111522 RepID=UPI00336BC8C8
MTNVKNTSSEINEIILVPEDTRELVKSLLSKVDNFSLKYNKYILTDKEGKINKKSAMSSSFAFPAKLLNNKISELEQAAKSLFGTNKVIFTKSVVDKLIVGLGTESVLETSITLHHIYGFPYIPGQSIKGAVRNYVIKFYFDSDEEKALTQSKTFCLLFGCNKETESKKKSALNEDYEGSVVFFDAFPTFLDNQVISIDIMNPHYGEYYQDLEPPADYLQPTPINFLVVTNTDFKFILGTYKNIEVEWNDNKLSLLELARQFTEETLTKYGIGAKTSVGYGYFK